MIRDESGELVRVLEDKRGAASSGGVARARSVGREQHGVVGARGACATGRAGAASTVHRASAELAGGLG